MTATFDIVVPALALRSASSAIDFAATRAYAERAAATWVDRFILSGSNTQGHLLTTDERANILDLWIDIAGPGRLLACCWEPDDILHATERGIAPMVTMRNLNDQDAAILFLRNLPSGAYIYSHPMFGGATFDAELADAAKRQEILPAGGKIAKIVTSAVAAIHDAAGDGFKLWDGSSRRIAASLAAGAAGVVATPLCAFDVDLPTKDPALIQTAVDRVQSALDDLPDRPTRTHELLKKAAAV